VKKQQGMTLIGAIFILVVVALLGQALVNISGMQRQSSLLVLQAARAYQTANTGIEWGIAQAIAGNCANSTVLNIPSNNFITTVGCTNQGNFTEDTDIVDIYLINSQSQYSVLGNPDFVSRELEAQVQVPQ
jgi:MSHA biogenesis protein MshP